MNHDELLIQTIILANNEKGLILELPNIFKLLRCFITPFAGNHPIVLVSWIYPEMRQLVVQDPKMLN